MQGPAELLQLLLVLPHILLNLMQLHRRLERPLRPLPGLAVNTVLTLMNTCSRFIALLRSEHDVHVHRSTAFSCLSIARRRCSKSLATNALSLRQLILRSSSSMVMFWSSKGCRCSCSAISMASSRSAALTAVSMACCIWLLVYKGSAKVAPVPVGM
jgi:hypothetical protein